jgi:hypothetical protein
MKKIFGLSLIIVGGGSIAYVLSLKDKRVAFVDNKSTKCDNLQYEAKVAFGNHQEFNKKNPSPDAFDLQSKPISYWQNIDNQRIELSRLSQLAQANFNNSDCVKSEKINDSQDCNRLKENIDTYKERISFLKKDPEINRAMSSVLGDYNYYNDKLIIAQKSYDQNNCLLNTKSDVSVSKASLDECVNMDTSINQFKSQILDFRKKALTTSGLTPNENVLLGRIQAEVNIRQNDFANKNCRNKIETSRLTDTAIVSTKLAEKMEQQVLSTNEKEKYVYLGVGAVVLLTGLLIVLKK